MWELTIFQTLKMNYECENTVQAKLIMSPCLIQPRSCKFETSAEWSLADWTSAPQGSFGWGWAEGTYLCDIQPSPLCDIYLSEGVKGHGYTCHQVSTPSTGPSITPSCRMSRTPPSFSEGVSASWELPMPKIEPSWKQTDVIIVEWPMSDGLEEGQLCCTTWLRQVAWGCCFQLHLQDAAGWASPSSIPLVTSLCPFAAPLLYPRETFSILIF